VLVHSGRLAGDRGVTSTVLDVHVIPRARRSCVDGERNGAILIRLAAPPVDGAANDALVAFLAGALEVPRKTVSIVSGEKSRTKRVRIVGVDPASARARLLR
jgi:uncharacterized protein